MKSSCKLFIVFAYAQESHGRDNRIIMIVQTVHPPQKSHSISWKSCLSLFSFLLNGRKTSETLQGVLKWQFQVFLNIFQIFPGPVKWYPKNPKSFSDIQIYKTTTATTTLLQSYFSGIYSGQMYQGIHPYSMEISTELFTVNIYCAYLNIFSCSFHFLYRDDSDCIYKFFL